MRVRVGLAAIAVAASLAACSASHAATTKPPHTTVSTFNAHAAELSACRALEAWERGNMSGTFADDANSGPILLAANNTPLEADLQAWVDDLQGGVSVSQIMADSDRVFADCGQVGVAILPNG